jgi:hypothetical protein
MDRRALFFVGAAVICAVLAPATPDDLRWVPTWMAVAYAVLALWSYLDFRSRRATHEPDDPDPGEHGQPNRPVT